MTGDNRLDVDDLTVWLAVAAESNGLTGPYLPGDANLDGHVDVADFNIWNSHRLEDSANWGKGDFNADGVVDTSDFNIWNQHKFNASGELVPEPDDGVLLMGLAMLRLILQKSNEGGRSYFV